MTREDKIEALQAKANALVSWFAGAVLPAVPFELEPHMTITNVTKYIDYNRAIMEAGADPYNKSYVCAYYRLFNLKKYIENGITKAGGKPTTKPGVREPGNK